MDNAGKQRERRAWVENRLCWRQNEPPAHGIPERLRQCVNELDEHFTLVCGMMIDDLDGLGADNSERNRLYRDMDALSEALCAKFDRIRQDIATLDIKTRQKEEKR